MMKNIKITRIEIMDKWINIIKSGGFIWRNQ